MSRDRDPYQDSPNRLNFNTTRAHKGLVPLAIGIAAGVLAYSSVVNKSNKNQSVPAYCTAVATPDDQKAVTKLFAQPELDHHVDTTGLHVHDFGDLVAGLWDTDARFDYYLNSAREIFGAYGVKVELNNGGNPKDGAVPSKKFLESGAPNEALLALMSQADQFPEEYFALSGLKQIVLTKLKALPDGGETIAYVKRMRDNRIMENDTIFFNLASGITIQNDATSLGHELAHLIDDQECGPVGMYNDQEFNSVNGEYKPYNSDDASLSLEAVMHKVNHFEELERKAINSGNIPRYCGLFALTNALRAMVTTSTEYGRTDIVEDKAEIASNIGTPYGSYFVNDSRSPILKAKFNLLMARLYHMAPRIVKYFADARGPMLSVEKATSNISC